MTLKRFGHISLTLLSVLLWVACDGDTAAPDPVPSPKMVNLSFSVGVTEAVSSSESRALITIPDKDNYFEREANRYEKIRTLRVIILRPAVTTDAENNLITYKEVEHNKLFTLAEDGSVYYDDLTFEVIGGENKCIYLLANEEAVNVNRPETERINFDNLAIKGQPYDGGIESIEISSGSNGFLYENTPEAATYIPLSEVYEDIYVDYPDEIEKRNQTVGPFYITRAAVKFSFSIASTGPEDSFRLKSVTFNSLADKEYYLPKKTEYDPSLDQNGLPNPEGFPNLSGHFITKYDIPENASHSKFTFDFAEPVSITNTPKTISPLAYFCESKLPTGLTGNPLLGDYPYEISITVSHTKTDKDGNPVEVTTEFGPTKLNNLPILPRNTHVRVNMSLTAVDLTCVVELVPYTGIWLNPNFGIADRE